MDRRDTMWHEAAGECWAATATERVRGACAGRTDESGSDTRRSDSDSEK